MKTRFNNPRQNGNATTYEVRVPSGAMVGFATLLEDGSYTFRGENADGSDNGIAYTAPTRGELIWKILG